MGIVTRINMKQSSLGTVTICAPQASLLLQICLLLCFLNTPTLANIDSCKLTPSIEKTIERIIHFKLMIYL